MDKNKFTPAPWEATQENCGNGRNIRNVNGKGVAHTATANDSANTLRNITHEEAKANAHLISAAPDMQDALMQWRKAEKTGDISELVNAVKSREQALKKARGEV